MPAIRTMIVDDEKEYIDLLSERLSMRGIRVTGATSGEEALSTLDEKPMDVIVLDVMMPGLDGIETLVEIKKRHPDVSVVLLSGNANMDTAIKGMKLGAYDYLVKPVALEELLYKIEDAYKARH
jgi:DNA-binding NtrC family response regulator